MSDVVDVDVAVLTESLIDVSTDVVAVDVVLLMWLSMLIEADDLMSLYMFKLMLMLIFKFMFHISNHQIQNSKNSEGSSAMPL